MDLDLDFLGAGAFCYFLADLDFDFFEALVSLGLLADFVGDAATFDLAGDVFLEAVFSFNCSNSDSSFLAECLLALLVSDASTAGFLDVVLADFF